MVATYDDAGDTYEQASWTYNGSLLSAGLTLLETSATDQVDRIAAMRAQTLSVKVGTHGNSLGTLAADFYDALPAIDGQIDLYLGTVNLFSGTIKTVDVDELRGSHTMAKMGAQDAGPDGAAPTTAPWGLSDTPNGTTTFGYDRLTKRTRTTEGGAAKVTYEVTLHKDGLWKNMDVPVTSVLHGLSATVFTIVDVTAEWPVGGPVPAAGTYTLILGESVLTLQELIADTASVVAVAEVESSITPPGMIALWWGDVSLIPVGWFLCDGLNSTPDLRDKFIVGADDTNENTGGGTVSPGDGFGHNVHDVHTASATHSSDGSHGSHGTPSAVAPNYTAGAVGGAASSTHTHNTAAGGHTHDAHTASGDHSTHIDHAPKYYRLAYIMKSLS